MSEILQRFHQVANDALVKISAHCLPGAKITLVIYTPGKPEEDILLKDQGLDDNEVVSSLRRRDLSIDGDNAYKRDLCDAIVGTLAFGAQDRCPHQRVIGLRCFGTWAGAQLQIPKSWYQRLN